MITATVSANVDKSIIGNVRDEPRDLVRVRFNDYLKWRLGVDNSVRGSVVIYLGGVDVRFNVGEPQLLPARLKSRWRWIVDVLFKEGEGPICNDRRFVGLLLFVLLDRCHVLFSPEGAR